MSKDLRAIGSPKIRSAYAFLVQAEQEGRVFTKAELSAASGWTEKTTKANLSKKLTLIVHRVDGGYRCVGAIELGNEGFCRICSQNSALTADPRRPILSQRVDELVAKARESALAAVQHYNNPTATFRSGNYLVLIVIGYTALFHAIFERDRVDYIERRRDGSPKLTKAGEPYHWDALYSARYYEQHYAGSYEQGFLTAVAKNIELLLPIRHQVEHRHIPRLDLDIGGHCQSMLLNFERILSQEFTAYYALNPSLSLALQFSTRRSNEAAHAIRRLQSAEYAELEKYISDFHAALPDDIRGDKAFELRVWMIQKPANHPRSADRSIEFVPHEQLSSEQYAELQRMIVAIKAIPGKPEDPAKTCNLYESDVLAQVIAELGEQVQFGDGFRALNGAMLREARAAHNITTPSELYYRPGPEGSRAYYGPAFVHWLIEQYRSDPDFFYKARQFVREAQGSRKPSST